MRWHGSTLSNNEENHPPIFRIMGQLAETTGCFPLFAIDRIMRLATTKVIAGGTPRRSFDELHASIQLLGPRDPSKVSTA